MPKFCSFIVPAMILLTSSMIMGQVHTVTASNETALPGANVTASITLDNEEGARGFSIGVAHSGGILTLNAITAGSESAASNAGAGPDFEFKDLAPAGGPGGTYGVILSFGAPLDEIAIGNGNEIALFGYTCSAAAVPGASEALSFSDALGAPVVTNVVSVVLGSTSISRIPIKVSGSISIGTPAPSGLTCSITDACGGGGLGVGTLVWTNGATYDSVEVLVGGVATQTLAGTATTTTTTNGIAGNVGYSVRGVRNLVTSGESNNCTLTYQTVAPPAAPSGVTCVVDQVTGNTTVTWTNPDPVSSVEVTLNGVLTATLGAGATNTVVTIGGPGSYNICVRGSNPCGAFSGDSCCTAVRDNFFIRNDMNQDGSENIADPVQGLNYLFGGGTMPCEDAADVNDDGSINIADIVYSLNVIFGISIGGSVPVVPSPNGACGPDPTSDSVSCASFNGC
ncbi:MAG: dockerin type I repeat-containing protein [Planctomycetota bacterium]|nr:dockerin type I repeat-containing protein [Planctomycetota bacterium]